MGEPSLGGAIKKALYIAQKQKTTKHDKKCIDKSLVAKLPCVCAKNVHFPLHLFETNNFDSVRQQTLFFAKKCAFYCQWYLVVPEELVFATERWWVGSLTCSVSQVVGAVTWGGLGKVTLIGEDAQESREGRIGVFSREEDRLRAKVLFDLQRFGRNTRNLQFKLSSIHRNAPLFSYSPQ